MYIAYNIPGLNHFNFRLHRITYLDQTFFSALSCVSVFDTFLWFLSPLVLSVSVKAWKIATDAPNVTILWTMLISFTQTFLVGIHEFTLKLY